MNTELSAVIEVLTKCWECTQSAAVNFGESRKVTFLEVTFASKMSGERELLKEKQPLQSTI